MYNCELCKIEVENRYGSGRFCGAKCARSFSTSKNRKLINKKISQSRSSNPTCKTCGQDASYKNGGTRKYCILHKHKYRCTSLETCGSDKVRKNFLIKENGYRCWQCGISEWQGVPAPLQLDHVNGDSDNNSRENLRILCANCHTITPTWGFKNARRTSSIRMSKRKKKLLGS